MPKIKLRDDAHVAPAAFHDLGLVFEERGDVIDIDAHVARQGRRIANPAAEVARIARALFTNRNVVDAETGKNPLHTCADCGVETFAIYRFSKHGPIVFVRATQGLPPHKAVKVASEPGFDHHKGRLCPECHAKPPAAAQAAPSPSVQQPPVVVPPPALSKPPSDE